MIENVSTPKEEVTARGESVNVDEHTRFAILYSFTTYVPTAISNTVIS
jgi:hypothetical protein